MSDTPAWKADPRVLPVQKRTVQFKSCRHCGISPVKPASETPACEADPRVPPVHEQTVQFKSCRRCGVVKPSETPARVADLRVPPAQEPTVQFKPCRRCGIVKPSTDFYKNKTNQDGLYNSCKACFGCAPALRGAPPGCRMPSLRLGSSRE